MRVKISLFIAMSIYATVLGQEEENSKIISTFIKDILEEAGMSNVNFIYEVDVQVNTLSKLWANAKTVVLWNDLHSWQSEYGNLKAYYNDYQLIVCYGSLKWALSMLEKVHSFFYKGYLSIQETRLIFVLNNSGRERIHVNNASITDDISQELKYKESVLAKLNAYVRKDMKVAVMIPNINGIQSTVACMSENNDNRILHFCGFWRQNSMELSSPLWPQPLSNYYGNVIRATVTAKPSVLTYKSVEGGLVIDDGWTAELMGMLQKKLNFTIKLVPSNAFGRQKPDGNWTGMVGKLVTDEADLSILDFSPLHNRLGYIEFSVFLSTDYEVILSKAPQLLIEPFILLQIFTPLMFGLLILVAILTGIIIGLITSLEGYKCNRAWNDNLCYNVTQSIAMVLRKFVYQSSNHCPTGHASRLLCGFAFFLALIIYSVYDGAIISFLAIPHRSKPIDTISDLFTSGSVPAVRQGSATHNFILEQNSEVTVNLMKKVAVVPGVDLSKWKFFSKLADGHYALLDLITSAIGRARRFEKNGQTCQFYLSKQPIKVDHDNFAFRRNFPLKQSFNNIFKSLRNFGIMEKLKKKHYAMPCQPLARKIEVDSLKLMQIQAAFYIFFSGITASTLLFILEICHRKA